MTNLEANKDKIEYGDICLCAHIIKYGKRCNGKLCEDCEFSRNVDECIKEILEEYKEPIKLTKFEYDLLKVYQKLKGDGEFSDHYILMAMQYKGHFKNVDYNLTIEEILNNCEVVDKLREVKYESSTVNR